MLRKTRLFTPGPTPLLPAAQNAIAAADMHHRTAEFREIFTRTLADLKTFIGTKNDVLILASSGSGAMEAAVVNVVNPGDKVIVASVGNFGERWVKLTRKWGAEVVALDFEWGTTISPENRSQGFAHCFLVTFADAKGPSCWFWSTGQAWGTLRQSGGSAGARSAQLEVAYGSVQVERAIIGGSLLRPQTPGLLVAGATYDLAGEA